MTGRIDLRLPTGGAIRLAGLAPWHEVLLEAWADAAQRGRPSKGDRRIGLIQLWGGATGVSSEPSNDSGKDGRVPIPFEFVIDGPPVSQQSRRRERVQEWIDTVRSAAMPHWDLDDPVENEVAVTITYFFDGAALDVDNIPKPILDALKGIVYFDDSQVFDLMCRKRDTTLTLEIPDPSPVLRESLEGFGQFLHITVTYALTNEVVW